MKALHPVAMAAAVLALAARPALAQVEVVNVPSSGGPAVPQNPPADPEDTPEEIAQDAARDLKDSSFYNKPGATRAQYDADWQTCRLIARGSRTPGGTYVYAYNPSVISPLAAGVGAGIGSLIGNAIVEGQMRRANRRLCLLYKGWRQVKVPAAQATRIAAMTDAQRDEFFNTIVGAETVDGEITELKTFHLAPDPAINLDAPLAGPASLAVAKKTDDPKAPITLGENEGALVLAFARPDAASAGRSGQLHFYRYDMAAQDLSYQPRDWKKKGDLTTYSRQVFSKDRKAAYELHVIKLTPGHYVIGAAGVGPVQVMSTNCFGAPVITVPAGKAVYAGDWFPLMDVQLSTGTKLWGAMGWKPHLDRAREGLATFQPALAATMEAAEVRNGATYACAAVTMTKWELPDVAQLAPVAPVAPEAAAPAAAEAAAAPAETPVAAPAA